MNAPTYTRADLDAAHDRYVRAGLGTLCSDEAAAAEARAQVEPTKAEYVRLLELVDPPGFVQWQRNEARAARAAERWRAKNAA